MGIEIERKFLVTDGWRACAQPSQDHILQGYLSLDPERIVRIRHISRYPALTPSYGRVTIKRVRSEMTRDEFEYHLPAEDAGAMFAMCLGHIIEKYRYHAVYANQAWVIDVFVGENQGLVVAEIELKCEGQEVTLPPWVTEEVTHDARYGNCHLATAPYSTWGTEE